MHAPISIINPKARLYKRFTPELSYYFNASLSVNGKAANKEIIYEKNRYRNFFSFRYEEADDKTESDEATDGIIAGGSSMAIKYNGKYKRAKRSVDEPESGDLIAIGDEFWKIESVQRIKKKTLNNFATIYLTINKIL